MSTIAPDVKPSAATPTARRAAKLATAVARFYFVPALVLALILLVVNMILQPNMSWTHTILYFAPFALVAMASGMAPLAGGGGIDLSLSALMTMCCAIYVVWLVPAGLGGVISIPIILLVGTLFGMLNGFIVTRLRISPLIATLSMNFVLIGLCLKIAPVPAFAKTGWVADLGARSSAFPIGLLFILVPIALWLIVRQTPFIRTMLATGSNDAAAFSSGVNVDRVRLSAYAMGGLVAGIGGFALVAVSGAVDASTAQSYLIPGLVAIALGGTAIEGGRGGIVGPLAGVAFIYLLQSALGVAGIGQSWMQIVYGAALVGAIIFSRQLSAAGGTK
ncbi:ABC transporter permease [Microbacterium sp. A196]|uniref:ABC transporter permease n=1 Tax=unclassified Microbacterium TaxID=2609290 RepID=UPI003FD2D8AD